MFSGLSEDALRTLTEHVRYLDFSPDDIVITEGTLGDTLYIIADGSVEVIKNLDRTDETALSKLKQHESFGEMSVIESVTRSASVRALEEPTVLYSIHRSDLFRLFKLLPEQHSILIMNIARDLCRRLRRIDELFAAKAN